VHASRGLWPAPIGGGRRAVAPRARHGNARTRAAFTSLIRLSGYLPWSLGLLVQIGGISYVGNSFLLLVAPDVASIVFLVPSFVAELSLALWLLVKGVDATRWRRQVRGATTT
jgi:phosphoglycerol transferase MdoB-like AlkP superfamily enzyme